MKAHILAPESPYLCHKAVDRDAQPNHNNWVEFDDGPSGARFLATSWALWGPFESL